MSRGGGKIDNQTKGTQVVGVISDTHGPLSPLAASKLAHVDHVIHAGDAVSPDAISALRRIAPLTAVRGNMDSDEETSHLPRSAVVSVGGRSIYVLHDIARLDLDPKAAGFAAVVHGHTHRAEIDWRDGVLFLNPGSAGFAHSIGRLSIALLTITPQGLSPKIIWLDSGGPSHR
jgi:hypothetical protein